MGGVPLGGANRVRVQTMTTTSTNSTDATVEQCIRAAQAGAEYVRITTQGVREAANLANIRAELQRRQCLVPLVADVHFNPAAAMEAAQHVAKVRINPGNFIDRHAVSRDGFYTDEEYAAELLRIEEKLIPLIDVCNLRRVAVRVGVNHGSLSDRIMSRYGDTPAGMVESAMEFLRIFRRYGFNALVISMKSSNTRVMVQAVRLLVATMNVEGMRYPLHLGVTEAGDGEDGRIKSAVGIGALLADGLGDTIRVSLTEEPEAELPVAQQLVAHFAGRCTEPEIEPIEGLPYSPYCYERRQTYQWNGLIGSDRVPVVVERLNHDDHSDGADLLLSAISTSDQTSTFKLVSIDDAMRGEQCEFVEVCYAQLCRPQCMSWLGSKSNIVLVLSTCNTNGYAEQRAAFIKLMESGVQIPVIIHREYSDTSLATMQLKAAADFGGLLIDGLGDGIMITANAIDNQSICATAFSILQAARVRLSKTEYIACPGCGRTLYDLQGTLQRVRAATSHLKGLKIGVMGCIVNGPGEMADADYGYVGASPGKISLYRGKEVVKRNIDEAHAIDELVLLIKESGDWFEA